MSCKGYKLTEWKTVKFEAETNDNVACLCTFPHNNETDGEKLDNMDVRSLAYLGAAFILARRTSVFDQKNTVYLPSDLPEWIREEIDEVLPIIDGGERGMNNGNEQPKIGDTRTRSGWLEDGAKEEWAEEWNGERWVATFSTGGIE